MVEMQAQQTAEASDALVTKPSHVQNDFGLKQKIRFDCTAAVSDAKQMLKELIETFPADVGQCTVQLNQMQDLAEKFKWTVKALTIVWNTPILAFEALPLSDRILTRIEVCDAEAETLPDEAALKRATAKATVLRAKSIILAFSDTLKVPGVNRELEALHGQYPDDLTITRCLVRSLTDFNLYAESTSLSYEQFEMKPILEQARQLNSASLTNKHGFTKYQSKVDFFELGLCSYYMSNDEYGRLSRKYLSRDAMPALQFLVRTMIISRLDILQDNDSKERHLRVMSEMLEGDKWRSIPGGAQLKVNYYEVRLDQYEQRNQGEECLNVLEEYATFVESLNIAEFSTIIDFHKTVMKRKYPEILKARSCDESKIKQLVDLTDAIVKPYLDTGLPLPADKKAEVFKNWFRTKTDNQEDAQHDDEMRQIVNLVCRVCKLEQFDPKKKDDLGSIMIGIFKTIIDIQAYSLENTEEASQQAMKLFMKINEGFEHVAEAPFESFRTEVFSLYLEVIIGMQQLGDKLVGKITACQEKLIKLYRGRDRLPILSLQNQKMEILVGLYFQSPRHVEFFAETIKAEEAKARESVQQITAIVGNSKCIKLAQHLIILTVCCALKRDQATAQRNMQTVWDILDNVKINRDLSINLFIAAFNTSFLLQIDQHEQMLARNDEIIKMLSKNSANSYITNTQKADMTINKISLYKKVGKHDECIEIFEKELVPIRDDSLSTIGEVGSLNYDPDQHKQMLLDKYADYPLILESLKLKRQIERGLRYGETVQALEAQIKAIPSQRVQLTPDFTSQVASSVKFFTQEAAKATRKRRKELTRKVVLGTFAVGVAALTPLGIMHVRKRNGN